MNIEQHLLTINPMSRPGSKLESVKKIVVHYVGNKTSTAIANRNYFENLKNQDKVYASSQYIIGLQGEVICCIPENEVAWHAGKYDMNLKSIGIENCHMDDTGKFNEATLNSLKELLVDLCKRYNLNPMEDIIRHYDVTGKRCPKYFVDNKDEWIRLKSEITTILQGTIIPTPEIREEYIVTARLGLNIRNEPNTNSRIVGGYGYNEKLEIIEIKNGWGKVENGYISMNWVKKYDENKFEKYRIVATAGLNVRKNPDMNSLKVTAYSYNKVVNVYEIINGWGRTKDGFILMSWTTKVIEFGIDYVVNATLGLNIRKGPGLNKEKIGAYSYNEVVTVYEITNGWGRTNDGFISTDFLRKI